MEEIDLQIEELEKKLNINSKDKSTIQNEFKEDGLYHLFNLENELDKEYKNFIQNKNKKIEIRIEKVKKLDLSDTNKEDSKEKTINFEKILSGKYPTNPELFNQIIISLKSQKIETIDSLSSKFDKLKAYEKAEIIHLLSKSVFLDIKDIDENFLMFLLYLSIFMQKSQNKFLNIYFHNFFKHVKLINQKFCPKFAKKLSYIYQFKLFSKELILNYFALNLSNFDFKNDEEQILLSNSLFALFKQTGFKLRKESPKLVKELIILLEEIKSKKITLLKELVQKIRFNQNFEVKYCPNFNKIKSFLNMGKHKVSGINLKADISLQSLKLDYENKKFVNSEWNEKNIRKSNESFLNTMKSSKTKYEKQIKSLKLETEKQEIIAICILSGKDYKDSVKNIFNLKVFKSKWSEIITCILKMMCNEKDFNSYYIYLFRELFKKIKGIDFSLLMAFWNFYVALSNSKEIFYKEAYLIRLFVGLIKLKMLDFKVLKNIDWSTPDTKQKKLNILFFKYILRCLSLNRIRDCMEKLTLNLKDALFFDDLKDFVNEYKDKYFLKHFQKLEKNQLQIKISALDVFKLKF